MAGPSQTSVFYPERPPPTSSGMFFSLFFKNPDTIKIVVADVETIDIIRKACRRIWTPGLPNYGYCDDGSFYLQLAGTPFSKSAGLRDAIRLKMLAACILSDLYAAGWDFRVSSYLSREHDLSTWFFEKGSDTDTRSSDRSIFCLALSNTDSLQLLGADLSLSEILKGAVQKSYDSGIQSESFCEEVCYELKLNGTPWMTSSATEGIAAQEMILEIIRQFDSRGFGLYATANLEGTVDCLFFMNQLESITLLGKCCMISLNATDRLRLIDCPTDIINITRKSINDHWYRGLQGEMVYWIPLPTFEKRVWEFKMRGYPWLANGSDTVESRSFLNILFNALLQQGWVVETALDISRKENDTAVFILSSLHLVCIPLEMSHFCLSLNESDKIRVIGGKFQQNVVDATRREIHRSWPKGILRERWYNGSYEFKLKGNPWATSSSDEQCLACIMMCRLLSSFDNEGWFLHCSADVSAKYDIHKNMSLHSVDQHSFWFMAHTTNTQSTETSPGSNTLSIVSPSSQSDKSFVINKHYYRILNQIGRGGSSRVYQVYDKERKLCFAVKLVDLADADHVVVTAYRNEIALLKRLQKYPNSVVRMYEYEYVEAEKRLYVVMEKGDTDLNSLFKSQQNDKLPDQMIAFYWLEMLKAVKVIHQEGIIHSDLKPANFLLVAGNLKLIDFGLSNAVPANKTSVTLECQMGTLYYLSPEVVCDAERGGLDEMKQRVSVKSDIWSLGCILYKMVYGKTPFEDIRNQISILKALLDRNHAIQYPPIANSKVINVMKLCLERDPKRRASIDQLLQHPYLK